MSDMLKICLKLVRRSHFPFRLIDVHISHNNCVWGEDDNRLCITCMTLDGHIIKIILWWITLFLNPRQPILQKVQMKRHTLPTGPMDFLMGPNSLC